MNKTKARGSATRLRVRLGWGLGRCLEIVGEGDYREGWHGVRFVWAGGDIGGWRRGEDVENHVKSGLLGTWAVRGWCIYADVGTTPKDGCGDDGRFGGIAFELVIEMT